jgi:hypothetical protein
MKRSTRILVLTATVQVLQLTQPVFGAPPDPAPASAPVCGLSPGDWCQPPRGDRCGRHRNVAACRADRMCYGVPYRGESLVACVPGKRGFSANCPAIGCTSSPPSHKRG